MRFLLSMLQIHIPNIKGNHHCYRELSCLQGFQFLTSNDLWPPSKTRGYFLFIWQICISCMKSTCHCYLDISCLHAMYQKTHAGQHYCKDSCLWQGINKHLNIVPPLFPYNFVWCLLETLFETKSLISIWQVSTITTKYILYVRFLENSFMMTAKVRFFVTNNDKSFKLHIYLWQPAMKSSWVQGKECFNWLPF